jgi:hypothetical protein
MEYLGVTTIDAKMEVIGELLRDVTSYNKWLADCYGAQVEKKYSRNDMVIYMVLKPPIIDERDIVLKDKAFYDWDNAKATISFTCTDEIKIPIEKKRTRVTIMDGVFDMEYLGRNKTKFIYRLKVDPAGNIPKKVAYAVMKSYPYDTLKGLKKVVSDAKYAQAAKGTDEEKQIQTRTVSEAYVRKVLAARLVKFVVDKGALQAIIAGDRDYIMGIMQSGGSYASVEKATTGIAHKYLEKIIADKKLSDKMKNDRKLIEEITELITMDCGAENTLIDTIINKYKKKYAD